MAHLDARVARIERLETGLGRRCPHCHGRLPDPPNRISDAQRVQTLAALIELVRLRQDRAPEGSTPAWRL